MKNLFAALLCLCLMLTGIAALAEGSAQEPTVVNFSDYEAKAATMEGHFAKVSETGLMMFVPAEFKDMELSEEAKANGTFMILKVDGKDVAVTGQLVKGDVEKVAAAAAADGHSTWNTIINGEKYVQFSVATNGTLTANFAFPTTDGNTLVFTFAMAENLKDAYTDMFKVMAASLQPAK